MDKHVFSRLNDEIDFKLLEARRLFFSDGVDRDSCTEMIRKLWYLELRAPGEPITFFINSPGGSVDDGFAVWDQVKMISSPITTLVTGMAASMGSILALCAPNGRRFATPNSRFLIHQPSVHHAFRGPAADIEIHAQEIARSREKITDLYAEITNQDRDVIAKALDRDTWMDPKQAMEFGLIDKIVTNFADIDAK